jgi:hypothetical protein
MLTAALTEPSHVSYIEFDSYEEIDALYEKEIDALKYGGSVAAVLADYCHGAKLGVGHSLTPT